MPEQRDNTSNYHKRLLALASLCVKPIQPFYDSGMPLTWAALNEVQQNIVDLLYGYVPLDTFELKRNDMSDMRIVNRVTITGADDNTSIGEMLVRSGNWPALEWGILFSQSQEGGPRFPSRQWVRKLHDMVKDIDPRVRPKFSAHICGKWVRDICAGRWTIFEALGDTMDMFDRFQLNFHAIVHEANSLSFLAGLHHDRLKGKQIIFQLDDVNNNLLQTARAGGINAVPLFDTSGGAGVLPDEWPEALDGVYCGYAGGLSPSNLSTQLSTIKERARGQYIWIDVERRVRTDDEILDLGLVEDFLMAAQPWLIR